MPCGVAICSAWTSTTQEAPLLFLLLLFTLRSLSCMFRSGAIALHFWLAGPPASVLSAPLPYSRCTVQLFLGVLVVPDSPAVPGRRRPSMTDPSRFAHLPFRCFHSTASTSCPSSPSLSSCYACSSHLLSYCLPLGSLLSLSSPSSRLCPMSVSFASYLYRPSHPTSSL